MSEITNEVREIPVRLVTEPDWNSRLNIRDDKELAALAESIEANGLQEPIKVEESDAIIVKGGEPEKAYTLVFGSRRLAAHVKLKKETIRAFVVAKSDPLTRTIDNVIENFNRKDLTSYEIGRACAHIRDQINVSKSSISIDQVAKQLGMSKNRLYQLTVAYETLPGDIKEAWKKEGSAQEDGIKVLDAAFVNELVALKEPDKQLKAYKERADVIASATEKGGKKAAKIAKAAAKKSVAKTITVTAPRLKAYKKAVKDGKVPQSVMKFVDYLFGEVDSVAGAIEAEDVDKGGKK